MFNYRNTYFIGALVSLAAFGFNVYQQDVIGSGAFLVATIALLSIGFYKNKKSNKMGNTH